MKRLLLVAALLVATPALAAEDANINATLSERSERCAGGDYLFYSCSAGEHRAALAIVARRDLLKRVGNLIADGKCDDARTSALRDGDFDLAQKVGALCRPPASQPQQ